MSLDFRSTLDDSKFSAALRRMGVNASKTASGISDSISNTTGFFQTLGSVAAVALAGRALSAISHYTDQVADLSSGLGLTTDQFQRLTGVFATSGVDTDKFSVNMQKLNAKIDDAKNGNKAAIESFAALGITLAQLKVFSPADILLKIADGLKNADDKAIATAAAFDVLGRGSTRMISALSQGSAELEAGMAKVVTASAAAIEAVDKFGDASTRAKNELLALGTEGFGTFLKFAYEASPAIIRIGEAIAKATPQIAMLRTAMKLFGGDDPNLSPQALGGTGMLAGGVIGGANKFKGMMGTPVDRAAEKLKQQQADRERATRISRINNAMSSAQSRLAGQQSSQLDFELMSPDERRQSRRDDRRVRRAQDRLKRVDESRRERGGRDARPGANAIAKQIALDTATITALATELAKLIPQQ